MEKTTVYLPEDLAARLRSEASRSGKAQAEIVRAAAEEYLDRRPRPGSIGIGEDSELNGEDSEEWLRLHWHPE